MEQPGAGLTQFQVLLSVIDGIRKGI